jgi:hypothetical protein
MWYVGEQERWAHMDEASFVRQLCGIDPEVERLRAEHVAANGRLVLHVWLEDVVRYMEALGAATLRPDADADSVARLAAIVGLVNEACNEGDANLRDAIDAGIVDHLIGIPPRRYLDLGGSHLAGRLLEGAMAWTSGWPHRAGDDHRLEAPDAVLARWNRRTRWKDVAFDVLSGDDPSLAAAARAVLADVEHAYPRMRVFAASDPDRFDAALREDVGGPSRALYGFLLRPEVRTVLAKQAIELFRLRPPHFVLGAYAFEGVLTQYFFRHHRHRDEDGETRARRLARSFLDAAVTGPRAGATAYAIDPGWYDHHEEGDTHRLYLLLDVAGRRWWVIFIRESLQG